MFGEMFLKPIVSIALKGVVDRLLPTQLQQAIDKAVTDWTKTLPKELGNDLEREAILNGFFTLIESKETSQDSPWEAVCEMILSGTVPTEEFWLAALQSHRQVILNKYGDGAQQLFKAGIENLEPHLKDLARRLHTACASLPALFGPDAHRRLIIIQETVATLEGLLTQKKEVKGATLELWAINGAGRNVVTGARELQADRSGTFCVSLQFAIRSNVRQTIRIVDIDYFVHDTDKPYGTWSRIGRIDEKNVKFRLDGNIEPPLECEPYKLYNFCLVTELVGIKSYDGSVGTDYGRGRIAIQGTDSSLSVAFWLNPGGEMLLTEQGWHGPEAYIYG